MLPNKMVSGKKDNVTYTVNNDKTIKLVATEPEPGKNLLPNNATSQTIDGVIFTVNDDGTILVNGTNTGSGWIQYHVCEGIHPVIKAGSYIFSNGLSDNVPDNVTMEVALDPSDGGLPYNVYCGDHEEERTYSKDMELAFVMICIPSGVTVDNLLFKPMMRKASITDDTYEPYGSKPVEIDLAGNSTNTNTLLTFKKNINCYLSGLNGVTLRMYSYDGIDRTEVYSGTGGTINFTDSDKHITHIILSINTALDKTLSPMLNLGTGALSYEMYQELKTSIDLPIYTLVPSATLTPNVTLVPKYGGKITVTFEDNKVTFFDYKNKELGSIEMPKTFYPNSTLYTRQDTTMVLSYVSSTSKGVPYDQIIKSINNSPETTTINADKVSLAGKEINLTSDNVVIKSTNFNVTKEGKIAAKQGSIGGWNIGAYKIFNEDTTSGNACCMQIPNYEYETGKYTNWVFAAGATDHDAYGDAKFRVDKAGAMYSTSGFIGGWNISSSGLTATGKAACEINKNGNIVMAGNYGQIKFDTNPVRVTTASKMIISDNYNTSTMVGTNDTIAIRAFNGTIQINSNYGVYAGSNRLDGSSSKAIKENIKPIEEEYANDIYNEVKKMPYYTYDYKEKYGDKDNIGFVIEDIEDTCLKRVLKINQNGENKDVKNFGTVDLSKMNLLLIKMLMDKIEALEKALKEERERDNNE